MLRKIPPTRLRLIERIVTRAESIVAHSHGKALAGLKTRGRTLVAEFLRHYYRGVGEDDLAARDPEVLARAALEHLAAGLVRRRGEPWVHVYNPDPATDGWSSPHTVVELIADDMPFLVDSLSMVFNQAGLALHFLVHPVIAARRDRRGRLLAVSETSDDPKELESWQFIEIDREADAAALAALAIRLQATLADVRAAVSDWADLRHKAREVAADVAARGGPVASSDVVEARDLLEWMEDNHFTFLGYRRYRLDRGRSTDRLVPELASGLGILRRTHSGAKPPVTELTGAVRRQARERELLVITKANAMATVHRSAYLDYVGVKTIDLRGEVNGEHRFLGLWTSIAYSLNPRDIPVLRQKITRVMAHFGLSPTSHDGKAALHVLENFPRDELFQASVPELIRIVRGVVNLYERQRVRLFVRRDAFRRFYSCLVYVPRDRYNTEARLRIEVILRRALHGSSIDSQVQLSESQLARMHLIVRTDPKATAEPHFDPTAIESEIGRAILTWADGFKSALTARYDEATARRLLVRYARAVPIAYQEDTPPATGVEDLQELEALLADPKVLRLRLYRPGGASLATVQLKLYRTGQPLPISDVLPSLENLGLRLISERPYEFILTGATAWIQDFELVQARGVPIDLPTDGPRLREAIVAVWEGRAENDGFNRLVLAAALSWRETTVLRAYCRWLLQTGIPFSQAYMESVLADNARTAGRLARLFLALFDTRLARKRRETEAARLRRGIAEDLTKVTRLDEDRILSAFLAAMDATLRTNYYQRAADGATKPYLSIKLDPVRVPDLPDPKPMFEVWIHSPRMEGVHLRKGRVARGGIRWSDRREDFRTEILGLMKAQNVKNTVIVPVGAKGGFVCKRLPAGTAGREAIAAEVVACYQELIRGLLDLTDNIVGGKTVPPADCVRRDGDDTYLVVAADKGTATFSDIANSISFDCRYWLGDAFASGGSAGYDHKRIAITSRGAWECVKRHFRELGRDVQSEDFTVAGVGDMSGDVFGNGMLRSKHIRLLAAFNHQHIFIDPAPDRRRSFAERLRLFRLPRSTWADYDRKALSSGGGVWSRADKSLKLTREAKALLGLDGDTAAANTVIKAILRLPVDLLWHGGIGTYVKAAEETDAAVGDRANDGVRVNGRELRAKVAGEGGNLGFSQRGRIEYALAGGRLNTDFIDNSGGVNCSDLEVNIKILLGLAMTEGRLRRPARDRLLASMTDEVAGLVLRNNYLQSQAISVLETHARDRGAEHAFAIRMLERSGDLDRALEFLPSEEALTERLKQGRGLTRPELSILLSYSKIWLNNQLIASDVPEDRYLSNELERYFPEALRRRYGELLVRHPLKREIIATATTNSLVNRMGPVFALRAHEDTSAGVGAIARAYAIARESTGMRELWSDIEALDNRVPASVQYEMEYETARMLRQSTYWVLSRRSRDLDVEKSVAILRPGLAELAAAAPGIVAGRLGERVRATRARYHAAGVPESLAARIATFELLQSGLDIVDLAAARHVPMLEVARCYLHLGVVLDLDWLRHQIDSLTVAGHWQAVARTTLRDNFYALHRSLADVVLRSKKRGGAVRAADAWLAERAEAVEGLRRHFEEMAASKVNDFATLSVALQSLRRLVEH